VINEPQIREVPAGVIAFKTRPAPRRPGDAHPPDAGPFLSDLLGLAPTSPVRAAIEREVPLPTPQTWDLSGQSPSPYDGWGYFALWDQQHGHTSRDDRINAVLADIPHDLWHLTGLA
jgi:hypothetical protein